MSGKTSIEWTDRNWPFARGCQRVSPGCEKCYAERMAARFSGPGLWGEGFARMTSGGARWTGKVEFQPDELLAPLRVRKPSRFFPSTIDPFHESITDEQLDEVFAVMALAPRHTFQILTKRPERMRAYLLPTWRGAAVRGRAWEMLGRGSLKLTRYRHGDVPYRPWPLPNVWLGVSVEDQQRADEHIPLLLQTPAAVRWISAEPLLGPVTLDPWLLAEHGRRDIGARAGLSWVVVGGESGPGARRCDVAWVRLIASQCRKARVPVFVKQLGANVRWNGIQGGGIPVWPNVRSKDSGEGDYRMLLKDRKGGDPSEWPEDLRVRQFPAPQS